jgi:hypothetical protein
MWKPGILRLSLPDETGFAGGERRMQRKTRVTIAAVAFVLGLGAALLYLREPTVSLTAEALAQARRTWKEGGIRSYHLKYRMHGTLYEVDVQDDLVTDISVDGRTLSIAQPGAYSVNGLFDVLELEIENLNEASRQGGQTAVNGLARVRFNSTLGYPERFVRGGRGVGNATLEMIQFTPR